MEEIKVRDIIGRDNLLSREIYPRINKDTSFILTGQRGIGKTEVLKWAYEHYGGEKLYLSCNDTYGEIIKKIAEKQKITTNRKTISILEKEVMKGESITLFIDDIEKMKPKQAVFFTAWNGWNKIYMAGVEPFREEAKKILWGKQKIKIKVLEKHFRNKLASHVVEKLGCLTPIDIIEQESKGIPGRAWALGKGEVIKEDDERVQGEEVNIAPVMLVVVVAIMITRYISLGMGEKDLYVLAGVGMGFAYLLRYIIKVIAK